MEFEPRKRYCQNRASKRKKEISVPLDPAEEERQFKLSRFVKDVSKFVKDKENDGSIVLQNTGKDKLKPKKMVTTSNRKPVAKVGLFQNGVQTHFCTRAAATTREMTARLDESLAEIIGLANSNTKTNYNSCQISHAAGCENPVKTHRQTLKTQNFDKQSLLTIEDDINCPTTPLMHASLPNQVRSFPAHTKNESLNELERKLYLEFTRLVTISCVEAKSAQFKKQSYASEVKRKLVDIYIQGKRENTQESSCASEPQKSSVGTSPLPLSPTAESDMSRSSEQNQLSTFTKINFVPKPTKSAREFLEETIGPSSSHHSTRFSPELDSFQPSPTYSQVHQPFPEQPSGSQPFSLRRDVFCHPELSPNLKYKKSPLPAQNFSPYDYTSMRIFGEIDRRPFNQLNWFLPPVEDDSPEFRYFPRMMF